MKCGSRHSPFVEESGFRRKDWRKEYTLTEWWVEAGSRHTSHETGVEKAVKQAEELIKKRPTTKYRTGGK